MGKQFHSELSGIFTWITRARKFPQLFRVVGWKPLIAKKQYTCMGKEIYLSREGRDSKRGFQPGGEGKGAAEETEGHTYATVYLYM